jgi:hypothetical protein
MLEDKIRAAGAEEQEVISGVEEFLVETVARERTKRQVIEDCVIGFPGNVTLEEGAGGNLPEEFSRLFKWADKRLGDQVREHTRKLIPVYAVFDSFIAIDALMNLSVPRL